MVQLNVALHLNGSITFRPFCPSSENHRYDRLLGGSGTTNIPDPAPEMAADHSHPHPPLLWASNKSQHTDRYSQNSVQICVITCLYCIYNCNISDLSWQGRIEVDWSARSIAANTPYERRLATLGGHEGLAYKASGWPWERNRVTWALPQSVVPEET